MAYLNANLPPIYCKVRKEYLYDLKEHHGESEECVIFSLTSISGRALLFNIMLPNGACYWRLPISAFFQKSYDRADVPDIVFSGTLIVILLMTAGQITKFKLHIGMLKITDWLQKTAIKCSMKWKKKNKH